MDFDALELPACARSPFGKYDDAVERFPIHSHIKQALNEKAHALGMTFTEYVRTVLECNVMGVKTMADLHLQRLRVIAGPGTGDVQGVDPGEDTGVQQETAVPSVVGQDKPATIKRAA